MSSQPGVSPETVQIAEESLRRCSEEFYSAFYRRFLASDPVIKDKFANTDFAEQNRQLKHGLSLLLIYAKRGNPALLERVAHRHSVTDIDVPPKMYPRFTECLLTTLKEFDPQYSPAIEQAWKDAVRPGIELMSGHYAGRPAAHAR